MRTSYFQEIYSKIDLKKFNEIHQQNFELFWQGFIDYSKNKTYGRLNANEVKSYFFEVSFNKAEIILQMALNEHVCDLIYRKPNTITIHDFFLASTTQKFNFHYIRVNKKLTPKYINEIFNEIAQFFNDNFLERIINEVFELSSYVINIVNPKELLEKIDSHRNRKGKQWRDIIIENGKTLYTEKSYLNKTAALKEAFENFSEKESYRKEFEIHFKSIYEKFLKSF
jgi:hypothetical protein